MKWIDVTHRLPSMTADLESSLLLVAAGGSHYLARLKDVAGVTWWVGESGFRLTGVTHWALVPPVPSAVVNRLAKSRSHQCCVV